ncbi:MAG TPA: DUF3883 domain-containing protein [Dermatophilaceae bacterium]|nr:DUF3883 domain-containing protein [Dermatophilaceae bacterium]
MEVVEGGRGRPWTRAEVEVAVAAYLGMLRSELRGEPYIKSEVVRGLQPLLPDRSRPSIERKLQNISAVLDDEGFDWIDGYKPLTHYQRDLRPAVLAAVGPGHRIGESLAAFEQAAIAAPSTKRRATDDVLVPTPTGRPTPRKRTSVSLTGSTLAAMRDFRTHQLGVAGEEWVLELEREQLHRSGRTDLAEEIRRVAREDGDGAGYDIRSFRPDGTDRLIEVKTTNLGARTPFYITRWEIEISRKNPANYSLYRVHGFARDPRIYVLDGSVEERARLEPKVFLGIPL